MTIKTFWTIFIKILGIWLLIDNLKFILQIFSGAPFWNGEGMDIYLYIILPSVGLFILILLLFFFKTSWIINQLNLDKGFTEEKLDLNFDRSNLISFACIIVGGLIFVDNLPQLLIQLYQYFNNPDQMIDNPYTIYVILFLVKTIIGYLLMTNNRFVADFITKQTARKNKEEE